MHFRGGLERSGLTFSAVDGSCQTPDMQDSPGPSRVGILVFDDVEVLDCCGPFEVFSVANRVSQRSGRPAPFDVRFVATTTDVTARGGLVLRAHELVSEDPEFDLLIVAGGVTDAAEQDADTMDWLSRSRSQVTASVCTGAFLLAAAGLVGTQKVTTHWEDQQTLQQRWPNLEVQADKRWVRDGDIVTSGGISAGIDMSLHLVEILAGEQLALATARQMEYRWARDPQDPSPSVPVRGHRRQRQHPTAS